MSAYEDVIQFTAHRYAGIQASKFGAGSGTQTYAMPYLFQATAALGLIVCIHGWRSRREDRTTQYCLAILWLAGLAGCFPRPDIFHIAFAVPLALPLLAYGLNSLLKNLRPAYRYAFWAVAIAAYLPPANILIKTANRTLHSPMVTSPLGPLAFPGQPDMPGLFAAVAATPPGDGYLFYPYMPLLPVLTAHKQMSRYDLFTPYYTTAEQYKETCLSALNGAAWLVIDVRWLQIDYLRRVFPAMQNTLPPETEHFHNALMSNYDLIATAPPYELRRRRDTIPVTACDSISG